MCKNCKKHPIIKLPNSNIRLCKSCFVKYFEKKVLKTIRKFNLIKEKEKIGIALSGGKDSLILTYLLNKIATTKKPIDLIAISIDEGIKNYRKKTLKQAKELTRKLKIKHHTVSFKKEFNLTLDQIIKKLKIKPCTACGVIKRYLLNKKARELGATKLATGHNLDDEAQAILMNQFKKNIQTSARLGPITGIITTKKFIKRIKPLYFLTEQETSTYANVKNLKYQRLNCPYSNTSYRAQLKNLLNTFEKKYPGTKHSIISSFIEILPTLKKSYNLKKIKTCKICKEPCSQNICQTCNILKNYLNLFS